MSACSASPLPIPSPAKRWHLATIHPTARSRKPPYPTSTPRHPARPESVSFESLLGWSRTGHFGFLGLRCRVVRTFPTLIFKLRWQSLPCLTNLLWQAGPCRTARLPCHGGSLWLGAAPPTCSAETGSQRVALCCPLRESRRHATMHFGHNPRGRGACSRRVPATPWCCIVAVMQHTACLVQWVCAALIQKLEFALEFFLWISGNYSSSNRRRHAESPVVKSNRSALRVSVQVASRSWKWNEIN